MYLHFKLYLGFGLTQVVRINCEIVIYAVCPIQPIPCLLMLWRLKDLMKYQIVCENDKIGNSSVFSERTKSRHLFMSFNYFTPLLLKNAFLLICLQFCFSPKIKNTTIDKVGSGFLFLIIWNEYEPNRHKCVLVVFLHKYLGICPIILNELELFFYSRLRPLHEIIKCVFIYISKQKLDTYYYD